MFRPLWFPKLLGLRSRSARRRQAAQQRHYIRLQLEGLEDRITPSTFTATNVTQLQDAITFANTHTAEQVTINLQANTTFNLTSQQELLPGAQVKIVGQGNDVITPALGTRAFKVDATASAEFDN